MNLHGRSGVRGMFAGVVPSIYRSALFSGAYVALVDIHKKLLRPFELNPVLETTLAALSSATLGTIFTHPFDVIRTHIQLDTQSRLSMYRAAKKIIQTRGVLGLQAGIAVKLLKRQFSYSMMWPTYEALMRVMGVDEDEINARKAKQSQA